MTEEKLVRGLGRWDLTAIAINTIIGTGIFILPARVTGLIGSYSLFAFVACGLIVALIVLCFAEVSSRFESTGGMYLYGREAFGAVVGFEVGWLYWIVRVATMAANTNAFLISLGFFFSGVNVGPARIVIISVIVIGITVVNMLGVRESAVMNNLFTVGKILPLLAFVAVGLFFVQPGNFTFEAAPEYNKFTEAVLLLIYAYVGFEAVVIPAGESKDPRRNLPFAMLAALVFCAGLFLLIQIVAIGTLPELGTSERPLADAASRFMGNFGGILITVGALVSVLGNLNGGFLAASRIPFAMAERRELPEILGRTHDRFRTPHVAIIFTGAVILIVAIYSSFFTAVTIATVTRLIVYATTCLALPIFRRRRDVPAAQFTVPLGTIVSVLSIALIIWLVTDKKVLNEGLPIVIAAAIGLVIYFAYRLLRKNDAELES